MPYLSKLCSNIFLHVDCCHGNIEKQGENASFLNFRHVSASAVSEASNSDFNTARREDQLKLSHLCS